MRTISVAIEQLYPKLGELERQYRDFRRDAPLVWNSDGKAINPHRERHLFLTQKRSETIEEFRRVELMLKQAEQLAEQAKSAVVTLPIIAKLLDFPIANVKVVEPSSTDPSIGKLLVEAIAERNRIAEELGEEDSQVVELDRRIELLETELKKIAKNQIDQAFANALKESSSQQVAAKDSTISASEVIATMLDAKKAESSMLKAYRAELEQNIESEKQASAKLAKLEQDDAGMQREIERNRELLNQLEEQMSLVEMQTEESQLRIVELTAPSVGHVTGWRKVGIATLLGLGVGSVLSLFLGLLSRGKSAAA
ncbi:GumC domain-containing protein [Novipirellula artificiosorum]|nr:hypothetical protein [Novipirellula artificiosorum]